MTDSTKKSSKPLVLITGGAGFIGSHTADALLGRGYRVRILDCLDSQVHGQAGAFPSYLDPRIECLRGDIRNNNDVLSALDGVSIVYHFAALTGVGQSMYDVKNYVDINVSGTANLIETIAKHKFPIKKFVLSSSRAVYGEGTHNCPDCGIVYPPARKRADMEQNRFEVFCPKCGRQTTPVATSEDRPLTPISIYGWTKKLQEELCLHAVGTFGLPVVILRYFNVYGSRQSLFNPYTGVVSIFFTRLKARKPISIYERGVPLRDFVHIRDIVQANLKAIESDLPAGSIFNIGTGVAVSIYHLAKTLAKATDSEARFEDNGQFRIGDIHSCIADLSNSKKMLNYAPQVALEEGMREFVEWASNQPTQDLYHRSIKELKNFGLFGGLKISRPDKIMSPAGDLSISNR